MNGTVAAAVAGTVDPAGNLFAANASGQWLTALGAAAGLWLAIALARFLASRHLRRLASKTDNILDDLLLDLLEHHTRAWFVAAMALFVGSLFLVIPPRAELAVRKAAIVLAGLQCLVWGNAAVDFYLRHSPRFLAGKDKATASTYSIITFLAKTFILVVVVLLTLHNLGINVTALVAGLGVGGVAVALALQAILGDLFASMAIVLDKPFEAGDAITVDDFTGTVEFVGLKTTRLRSVTGEELVFSNADLLRSRIRNLRRMTERRMTFSVGVTYRTPQPLLARIPQMLREAVEAQEKTRFDRAHLVRFADSSILYEASYFVLDPGFNLSLDVHQAVHLAVAGRLAREGVELAFPTTTVLLERKDGA